jgi:hypothetical protein
MNFAPMMPVFPGQSIWGAKGRGFSFVITHNEDGYTASAKLVGTELGGGSRIELGGYCAHATFKAAVDACRRFLKERH